RFRNAAHQVCAGRGARGPVSQSRFHARRNRVPLAYNEAGGRNSLLSHACSAHHTSRVGRMIRKSSAISALLSFNGGFVDTAGFLGFQGLFTAHVTGNFVTLAATLISGTHGVIAK